MTDVKIKKKNNTTIKTLDRASIIHDKLKNALVDIEQKTKEQYEKSENSEQEYAQNKIEQQIGSSINYGTRKTNSLVRKSLDKTKDNFRKSRESIKKAETNIKNIKKAGEKTVKTINKNIKTTEKGIKQTRKTVKTAERTTKVAIKTTQKVAKTTAKVAKRTVQATKVAVKTTVKATQTAIKTSIAIIKAIIAAIEALISAIAAGGWVVVLIIAVISIIAMIIYSIAGIFLSNEELPDITGGRTMSSAIYEINTDFTNKITEIQTSNVYDDFELESNPTNWKDVLSIYTVKTTNGENATEVASLDSAKILTLKDIFWSMNIITSTVSVEQKNIEVIDDNGNITTETISRRVLHIKTIGKTVEEIMDFYKFDENERKQVAELQKQEYEELWNSVFYGSSVGSTDIVEVAKSQIGNVGGEPYWRWYGYPQRVEWCATFVSWCAEQCGYIQQGIIPKFSNCQNEGIPFFKTYGRWKERGYSPKPGDIIFFDWINKETGVRDGKANHVGIVEFVEDGKVHTIEGNTSNRCDRRAYDLNSLDILGYGTPDYK